MRTPTYLLALALLGLSAAGMLLLLWHVLTLTPAVP